MFYTIKLYLIVGGMANCFFELYHRSSAIKKRFFNRAGYRRSRWTRKLRYRQPRWANRSRKAHVLPENGWVYQS